MMDSPNPNAARLAPEEQQRLDSWLREFDLKWEADALARRARQLPPDGPLRRAALVGMVTIDLRRQRQHGRKKPLEDYLRAYPELGTPETVTLDLIQAEVQARRRTGDLITAAELARRFPRQMGRLQRSVAQLCADPAPDARAAAVSTPAAQKPTAQKGRYEILKELGRGAMGTVYLARDTQLGRQVAMKIPHFRSGDRPDLRERFLREVSAAAKLDHPNICPVYDGGEEAGIPYLTMAYIDGQTLAKVLDACKPMPQRRAVEIVAKLASALDEIHCHAIVHRHVTPSNVMVNRRGEPIIIDFGLARRLDRDVSMLHQGSILGTPAYMSPEQVNGDIQAIGPASDQYSLGVILYELLTGQVPFQGSLGQVMTKILSEAPRPPSWLEPDLDAALEEICLRAMAKRIPDRFPSAGDFGAALARWLEVAGPTPAGRPRGAS
jgi:predicted Ser/Thr protein kinase